MSSTRVNVGVQEMSEGSMMVSVLFGRTMTVSGGFCSVSFADLSQGQNIKRPV